MAPYGATIDEVISKDAPAPISSNHTPLFALIAREAKREYKDVAVGTEILAASTNDSRYLRNRGITCYGLWPFEVDYFETLGIHHPDERIRIDWYMQGIALMRRIVAAYALDPRL
jgi:acetylornithine deacetylase/succinyl-diaminopimelate desuccinylase-like protein